MAMMKLRLKREREWRVDAGSGVNECNGTRKKNKKRDVALTHLYHHMPYEFDIICISIAIDFLLFLRSNVHLFQNYV